LPDLLIQRRLERLLVVRTLSRRAEKISSISLWRRCFQWVICVGCTPYVLAHSLTVLSPLRASNATRALHSALYC
jgi:hypothetical protein